MANTQQGYVDVDGGRLYYETAGAGQALVLTHAAFLDSRMFDGMWPALAARFRVIRYDLRGFGRSSPANSPLCRRRDLETVLNALDVERAHLVGCSNGGTLSLDLALEQPSRAASLTCVGSAPSGFAVQGQPPRYMLEMFEAAGRGDVDRVNELQIRIWLDGEYREPGQVDPELRRQALAMNRIPVMQNTFMLADSQPADPLDPPALARLESAAFPALIVTGALDHPEVLRAADEMAGRIPRARKVSLPGCGHVPSYEQPAAFAALLLDFLDGLN